MILVQVLELLTFIFELRILDLTDLITIRKGVDFKNMKDPMEIAIWSFYDKIFDSFKDNWYKVYPTSYLPERYRWTHYREMFESLLLTISLYLYYLWLKFFLFMQKIKELK